MKPAPCLAQVPLLYRISGALVNACRLTRGSDFTSWVRALSLPTRGQQSGHWRPRLTPASHPKPGFDPLVLVLTMNEWPTSLNLSVLICKIETACSSWAAAETEKASRGGWGVDYAGSTLDIVCV